MPAAISRSAVVLILMTGFAAQLSAQSPEFSTAVSPATVTLTQGGVTSFTVTIDASDHPKIDLSLSGLPEGVRANIPPGRAGNTTIVLIAGSTATTMMTLINPNPFRNRCNRQGTHGKRSKTVTPSAA